MKVLEEMNCKLKFAGWGGTMERESKVGVQPRTGILYRGSSMFWVLASFRSVRNGMECPFQGFLSPNPLLFKLSLSWGCQMALCWPGLMERTCRSSQQNCYPLFCSCSVLTESKQEQGLQIPDLLLYVFTFFFFFGLRGIIPFGLRGWWRRWEWLESLFPLAGVPYLCQASMSSQRWK